jgi:hypothetical protein
VRADGVERGSGDHALEDTFKRHDSLNEQRLCVLHVEVEESHESDTLCCGASHGSEEEDE